MFVQFYFFGFLALVVELAPGHPGMPCPFRFLFCVNEERKRF